MTSRLNASTTVGRTHASSVIAVVRCNDAASAIVTSALTPLNESAPPCLPSLVHVALTIVPLLPLPDQSIAWLPAAVSKEYAATRPVCLTPLTVQLASIAEIVPLYCLSAAVANGVTVASVIDAVAVAVVLVSV